jgi:hypothetical protein
MIGRFKNLMKFFPIIILLFLVSCGESKEEKSENSLKDQEVSGTILQLKGTWIEIKDSLHILEFSETEMIDFYNNSEINRYGLTFFDGLPGEGGFEDASGKVIQIEESKDNFHHFTILILDSNYLELIHRSSGVTKKYNRLKK